MRPILVLVALLLALPVQAQSTDPVSDPDAGVRAAVAQLFDGMRARDTVAVRAVLHPSVRLQSVAQRGGEAVVVEGEIDGFLSALAASPVAWDEHVSDLEVRHDGALATAWMGYRFYAGETFSHCGVNAMQFVRTAAGWQIVQIIDTRRTACD